MNIDHKNEDNPDAELKDADDSSPFQKPAGDKPDLKVDTDLPPGWKDNSLDKGWDPLSENGATTPAKGFGADLDTSQTDDMDKVIFPSGKPRKTIPRKTSQGKKQDFNPWRKLDEASRKTVSRRDLLRGVFRFLPKKNDE